MRSFLEKLLRLETLVAGVFYAIAATLLFADVVGREVLGQSIWGSQRMAVLFANGAALIGISVAVSLNRHIRPNVLDFVTPQAATPVVQRLSSLTGGVVMLFGTYFAIIFVLENRAMGFTTPPLRLEIWVPQLALVYGLASSGLKYLLFAVYPDLQPEETEVN